MKEKTIFTFLAIFLVLNVCSSIKVKLIGGGNRDLYFACEEFTICKGYLDSKKGTIFEKIPQADGYFLLKTPYGKCVKFGPSFFAPAAATDCISDSSHLWKNAAGQVFNKYGNALWWDGDNRAMGVTSTLGCAVVPFLEQPFAWQCKWNLETVN